MSPLVVLIGLLAASAEFFGGYLLARRGEWPARMQLVLLALGAGFMLSLVFLKLIPVSFGAVGEEAFLLVLLGYALLHFFEHTVVGHFHFGEEVHADAMTSHTAGLTAFSGLLVHAFFDGLSISVGFSQGYSIGVLISIAVLLHKFPEGLTIASIMLSAGFSRSTVIRSSLALGAATLVGVATLVVLPEVSEAWLGRILAFSAGTLIYVGASDLIPEINKAEERMPPVVVFGGIALYYLSDLFLSSVL